MTEPSGWKGPHITFRGPKRRLDASAGGGIVTITIDDEQGKTQKIDLRPEEVEFLSREILRLFELSSLEQDRHA